MLRPPLGIAWGCACAVLVGVGPAAWAQDAEPPAATVTAVIPAVSQFDFESDASLASWVAADAQATLGITHERENVAGGNGALEFLYEARPGVFQQLSTGTLQAESASALVLRVKASSPTSISLGVAERGGARYQGLLWIGAGQWADLRVPLADLILAQDSSDDDGHLSAAEVTGFFLADLSNLPGEVGQALGRKTGEQRLWIDDLALLDDPRVGSRGRLGPLGEERLLALDDFEASTVWGLPVREAGLRLVPGAPQAPGQRGLEISYTLGLGRWVGYVMAPPGHLDLSTAQQLRLWVKTDLNARLVVALEERDGTKYDAAVKAPADGKWHPLTLPFDVFAVPDPAADENGVLDAGQVHRVIILVDTFDADVRPGGIGSVTIDDVGLVGPVGAVPEAGQ